MLAWGVTEDEIRATAESVGLRIYGTGFTQVGRALRFRIAIDSTAPRDDDGFLPYQRCSMSHFMNRRRIPAVCWHGHRDFMRVLFDDNPEVRLKTCLADYRGRDDFERKYRATFGKGNGWNMARGQACNCKVVRSPHRHVERNRALVPF